MSPKSRAARASILCVALTASGCLGSGSAECADLDAQLRYYAEKAARYPTADGVHVQLAGVYLRKASESHDPALLAQARASLARAEAIQNSYEAMRLRVQIASFTHRFGEVLELAARAERASPYERRDPQLDAFRVDAYLGLGEPERAGRLLPLGQRPADFHTAAALGRFLAARARPEEAAQSFGVAAEIAREAEEPTLAAWAEVMAAGVWIDAGAPARAHPHLSAAARLDPGSRELRIHRAELAARDGRPAEALHGFEALLAEAEDPLVAHRAFLAARALGREAAAQRHYATAERLLRRAIDAGEVYTLGALAQLHADAGVRLAEALALAQRNLTFKRDAEARATLAAVQARLAEAKR